MSKFQSGRLPFLKRPLSRCRVRRFSIAVNFPHCQLSFYHFCSLHWNSQISLHSIRADNRAVFRISHLLICLQLFSATVYVPHADNFFKGSNCQNPLSIYSVMQLKWHSSFSQRIFKSQASHIGIFVTMKCTSSIFVPCDTRRWEGKYNEVSVPGKTSCNKVRCWYFAENWVFDIALRKNVKRISAQRIIWWFLPASFQSGET